MMEQSRVEIVPQNKMIAIGNRPHRGLPYFKGRATGMDRVLRKRVEKLGWLASNPRAFASAVFGIFFSITILAIVIIESVQERQRQEELYYVSEQVSSALSRRIAEHIAYLEGASALFYGDRNTTERQFEDFIVTNFHDSKISRGVSVGWIEKIPLDQADAFVARQRANGRSDFQIYPEPDSPAGRYHKEDKFIGPVTYITPQSAGNMQAVGFNLYSERQRRRALMDAEKSGEPQATGKLHLIYDDPAAAGIESFILVVPVFKRLNEQMEQGALNLRGFIYAPIRAQSFLDSAAHFYGDIAADVTLYDGDKRPENFLAQRSVEGDHGGSVDRAVMIAGKRWTVNIVGKKQSIISDYSLITLVFGLVTAVLLAFITKILATRSLDDRKILESFQREASIRISLSRELNHRVKNTLANVLSILALTRKRYASLDDFADTLTARIRALSATHDLLTASEWQDTPIEAIIRSELAPYMGGQESSVELSGVNVNLAPNDALSLGLAIHELATNAAKYGSLSVPNGGVRISWDMVCAESVRILWEEWGGPAVEPPSHRGFGVELLEKIVSHELNTKVELLFMPQGLRCTFMIPVRQASDFILRESK